MVKGLIDRLVARQTRLMSELSDPAPSARTASERVESDRAVVDPSAIEAEVRASVQARAMLKNGDLAAAKALLQEFSVKPRVVEVAILLGRLAFADGLLDEALVHARNAEVLDSQDPDAVALLAACHEGKGNHFDEVRYRRMLVHTTPSPTAADTLRLARALLRTTSGSKRVSAVVKEIRSLEGIVDAAVGATVADRVSFAELLFQFPETERYAATRRATIREPAAHEVDSIAKWTRLVDYCHAFDRPIHRLTDAGMPKRRPYIAELRDVYVDPGMRWIPVMESATVVSSDHAASHIVTSSEDPTSCLLMSSQRKAMLRTRTDVRVLAEPALLLGGSADYHAQCVDFLGALAVSEALHVDSAIKLIVNDDLAPFQLEQFRHLGIEEHRLVRVPKRQPLLLKTAIVPSRAALGERWVDPLVVEWHRRRLGRTSSSVTRRIYIRQPRSLDSGRLVNEAEVESTLRGHGFECISFDPTRVRELTDTLASAACIVGVASAALANMMYAPVGASVIALVNRRDAVVGANPPYAALAKASGHRYVVVPADLSSLRQGQHQSRAEVRADLLALSHTLEEVLP